MSSITNKAAASLLHKATLDVLRRCRGSNPDRSAETLAHCATPQLVDVVMSNDTLMHALALDYAMRVVVELPPAKPDTAPTKAEWSFNLFEPEAEK